MKPRFRNFLGLTTAIISFTPVTSLMALDYTWTGTTSNVSNVTTNWNPNGNPGTADNVLIDDSTLNTTNIPSGNWDRRGAGTTTISGTGIVNLATGSARFLNNGAFTLSGGELNQNGEYFIVANAANGGTTGTFTHSGGTLTSTHRRGFFVSDGGSCLGSTYTLSGGTMNVSSSGVDAVERKLRSVWLGKGGDNAVTASVTGDTFLVTSGTATFTRTHATNAYDLMISRNSVLQQQGGTVTFDKYSEVRIGYGTNGDIGTTPAGANNSKISISGGTLNITGGTNVRVGFADAGTIEMTGGALNLTGNLNVGVAGTTGTVTMTGGILTVTNAGTDVIGGGNNGNASIALSGTAVLNAGTTKWKTGDFGGTGNAGATSISLSDSASLTLREFTIGHIGSGTATETVTLAGTSNLTVNNFITIGRDDNATQSGMVSSLNLNGGTLSTKYIIKGSDSSNDTKNHINANGGTIKALAEEADFFKIGTFNPGRVYVNLQAGGLNFDTNGFDVGIQTGLHGTGGLTKLGAGTLTLSNDTQYTGTTVLTEGTLQVTTGNFTGTAATVADGTTLAVTGDASQSWKATDLTLGSSTGATVEIRNFVPNSGAAAIDATGSLVPQGTVTVKIIGTPTVGVFPLITYPFGGSIGGAGLAAFQLAPLPRGVVANLVDNGEAVALNVTALNVLKWKGNVNSNWDINATSNWLLGAVADKYQENDNVRFDDTANAGSTTISLNTVVAPASVTFDNTSKDYTLGGAGSITGLTTLTKLGGGMLTLNTANTYTGLTTISAGTLRFGDGASDGSLAGPLLVSDTDVIFNTTGSPVMSGALDGYGTATTLTKTGPGTQIFTGAANTYSGSLQIDSGTFQIGDGTVNGSFGSGLLYELAGGAQLRLNYATASAPGWGNVSGAGILAVASAQPVNATADWGGLALAPEFTGTLRVEKGRIGSNSGNSALGGATKIEILPGAQFLAFTSLDPYTQPIDIAGTGWGEGGYPGGLRLAGSATATWAGNVTLTGDSSIMAQRLANFTIAGSITGPFQCEFYAGDPVGDSGTVNVTPTTAIQNSYGSTRINGRPAGRVIAGNPHAFSTGPLQVTNAILQLDGHSFSFANLNGTGGRIGNYHSANTSVLTVGADNTSTAYSGVITDGGTAPLALTKNGTGTLTLTGANDYSGDTTINQGTLSLSNPYLSDTATVTIVSGGVIDLATGEALDTVGKLILGGVTVPSGTYNSSHATYGAYFTGTGSLVVPGGYSSWATSKNLDATNNGLTLDPDFDGTTNLMEFYLNGNPLAGDPSVLPLRSLDATYLTLTFSRRDDAEADVGSQVVQYGTTLGGWTDVPLGAATAAADANGVIVTVAENGTDPDTITVQIPRSLGPDGTLFARLKIAK